MTIDACLRFIGVPSGVDAATLLGLPLGRGSRVDVEMALRRRLERVYRHPAGRSAEADEVRRLLRGAAEQLIAEMGSHPPKPSVREDRSPVGNGVGQRDARREKAHARHRQPATRPATSAAAPGPRPRTPVRHELTEFDRLALATLVACGGWNARSRAQLVALAGQYGLSVEGLLRVICGLSDYARSGGEHLDVADITSGADRMAPIPMLSNTAAITGMPLDPSRIQPTPEPAVPPKMIEPREASPWTTLKLCVAFGLATIVFGIIVGRAVLHDDAPPTTTTRNGPVVRAPIQPPEARPPTPETEHRRVARFVPLPNMRGNAVPLIATRSADRSAEIVTWLDEVQRRLSITDDPAEPVFRTWAEAIGTMSAGWGLIDGSTEEAAREGIRLVLYETVGAPSVGDRLLDELRPPPIGFVDPLDAWRGAWRASVLGEIGESATLPPTIVEQARAMLAIALGAETTHINLDRIAAARRWLDRAARGMLEQVETNEQSADMWELWLAAQRRIGGADAMQRAIMLVIAEILRSDADLQRAGPLQGLLGRLLREADFRASATVRDSMRGLFLDERITDDDLWIVTSLLAQIDTAPWFDDALVLPPDGGMMFRSRIRDRIAAAWPTVERDADADSERGRAITVDADLAARWATLVRRVHSETSPADAPELMERLVAAAQLNEIALLLAAHDTVQATALMDAVAAQTAPSGEGTRPPWLNGRSGRPIGQAMGTDGDWSRALDQARRDTEERVELVRTLGNLGGSDLGPVDATSFVELVYGRGPREVRERAQTLLLEQFGDGPNVALEMLDQFPTASRGDDVAATVAQLTGAILPSSRHENWPVAARLALVRHAVSLRRSELAEADEWTGRLGEVFSERADLVRRAEIAKSPGSSPRVSIERLTAAWRERADAVIALIPVPDTPTGLARRRAMRHRLAEGTTQVMLAEQVTVLDHLAYVAVGEHHEIREAVAAVLAESTQRRAAAEHVLQQSVETEQAMSRIWMLRMELTGGEDLSAVRPPSGVPSLPSTERGRGESGGASGRPGSGAKMPPTPGEINPRPRKPPGPGRGAGGISAVTPAFDRALLAAVLAVQDERLAAYADQLRALDPAVPLAYFELAEEIADIAEDPSDFALARRLLALAALLDAPRLGRSACLALADLESVDVRRRQLIALAGLLGERRLLFGPAWSGLEAMNASKAYAIGNGLSAYRRGDGPEALEVLEAAGAVNDLDWIMRDLPGGARRFLEDCRLYRGQLRPNLSSETVTSMLHIELALLAGDERPLSADLRLMGGRPLIEVDPDRLEDVLGVDTSRPYWRDGRWVDDPTSRR